MSECCAHTEADCSNVGERSLDADHTAWLDGRYVESRPFRPFQTSEEYLYAMKEDLTEWLNVLYGLGITAETFMERLDTGTVLCNHANQVRKCAEQFEADHVVRHGRRFSPGFQVPGWEVHYNRQARAGSFFARDNIHNFIRWCNELGVLDCLMFETEDLVSRKNEKHVILCLLEIARRGAKFGMAAPMLVQFEQQIDREIARDESGETGDDESGKLEPPVIMVYGPGKQVVTNDLKSLDEMVRDLVARCTCPSQFPMIRVSEGKYRIGDTKTLIFVRILRNHVMVRVGGGWDTLQNYLNKHDPCRCKAAHRTTKSAKLFMKTSSNEGDRKLSAVKYDRVLDSEGGSPPVAPPRSPSRKRTSLLPPPDGKEDGERRSDHGDHRSPAQARGKGQEQPPPSPTPASGRGGDKPTSTRHPLIASALKGLKSLRPGKNGTPPSGPPSPGLLSPTDANAARRSSVDTGRHSFRASRSGKGSRGKTSGQNTWSGGQRSRQRPALSADTFSKPGSSAGPGRATSASPAARRRGPPQSPSNTAAPPRPGKGGLLEQLMSGPDLDDDQAILRHMEQLLRQYRPASPATEVAPPSPHVAPRKDGGTVGKSRIPAPTFFQPREHTETLP